MSENKLIIVSYQGKTLGLLFQEDKLQNIKVYPAKNESLLGNIYVGKVQSIAKNIHVAFVEVEEKQLCFLPLTGIKEVLLCNRTFDGSIRCGDELIVQVEKDPIKTKQPVVTTNISLAGKYISICYGNPKAGFSKKLSRDKKNACRTFLNEQHILRDDGICILPAFETDQKPLKEAYGKLGIIVRTNVENLSMENFDHILTELQNLCRKWQKLLTKAYYEKCFHLLSDVKLPVAEDIKNYYEKDYEEIVTDLPDVYEALKKFPSDKPVRLYEDDFSLAKLYGLKTKINEVLEKKVWMKSGAYLIIEPTEALTVIDVNSGQCIKGSSDAEDTFFQINEEAALECARQLRLRNLSGIILIDFINMESEDKKEEILHILRKAVSRDEVQTNVIDYTALGLVEVTRKRVSRPLRELLSIE